MSECDELVERYEARLVAGAQRYASYDRSDPFALDRCMCHIRQGLCKAINPLREEIDGDGRKHWVPTGLLWHWDEPILYKNEKTGQMQDIGRKQHCRTEIIGNAGAPGHYDAVVISSVQHGH